MNRLPERLDPEPDSFGLMTLGALATAERFIALIESPGGERPPVPQNQPLLLAMLGLISLSRTLNRRLEDACPAGGQATEARPLDLQGILR